MNYYKKNASKSFFFSQDSKETYLLIFEYVLRKVKSWIEKKHSINTIYI